MSMNVFGQDTRTPLVVERSAHNQVVVGGGAITTLLEDVSSIHAVYIDVFIKTTTDIKELSLVMYAANGTIAHTQQINGTISAGSTKAVRWGGSLEFNNTHPIPGQAIGQFYDLIVETDPASLDGLVSVWTAARS